MDVTTASGGRPTPTHGPGAPPLAVRALPVLGLVSALLLIVNKTVLPVIHATDEVIFRRTLEAMHRGQGFYPAYRAALAHQDVAGSQVRSFRIPTEFLLLRPFPVSSYRWLAAAVVLASVLLCWRLAREAHPAVQAVVLVGSAMWLSELLDIVYLYAEVWALPGFLLALVALRDERWTLAAVALTVAVCTRELYAPALLLAIVLVPRAHRRPFVVGLGVAAVVGAVHYGLASQQLVEVGAEAPFNRFADLGGSLQAVLSPRPHRASVALPLTVLTVLGAVGTVRAWRVDLAARLAGATSLALFALTLYGGRVYWPLLFSPVLVAFVGAALPRGTRRPSPAGAPAEASAPMPATTAG